MTYPPAITNEATRLSIAVCSLFSKVIMMFEHTMRFIVLAEIVVGIFVVDASLECETKFSDIGCFQDDMNNRALPTQLLNERDRSSLVFDGFYIEWERKDFMSELVCRCAEKAKSLGYTYFGIQFYGECWSGESSHQTYNKHGKSDDCQEFTKGKSCNIQVGKADSNFVYRISDRECDIEYTSLGCFNDFKKAPRPVPQYSMNERDKTSEGWNGHLIKWKNWNTYFPGLICRCAKKAKSLKHDIFSIQYYAECWTGKKINSNYDRDGVSKECVGKDFNPCKCNSYHCAGVNKVNYVYELSYIYQKYIKPEISQDSLSRRRDYHYYDYPSYQNGGYFSRYRRKYGRGYRE